MTTKPAGAKCPRCRGQILRPYRDEPAACVQCGYVPPGQAESNTGELAALMQADAYRTRGEKLT